MTKIAPLLDAIAKSEKPDHSFQTNCARKEFRSRKLSNISLVRSGNAGWTQAII